MTDYLNTGFIEQLRFAETWQRALTEAPRLHALQAKLAAIGATLLPIVHDEWLVECPQDRATEAQQILADYLK